MGTNKEIRTLTGACELRADSSDSSAGIGVIVGYAAKFNALSLDLGGFREAIAPGAFTRSLADNPDVRALYNHDTSFLLGRVGSGTLSLREDPVGLAFELSLPDTSVARDLRESIKRGDLAGCSFGFSVREDTWVDPCRQTTGDEDCLPIRTLVDVELFEISFCAFPAYPDTSVALRSYEATKPKGTPKRDRAKRLIRICDSLNR